MTQKVLSKRERALLSSKDERESVSSHRYCPRKAMGQEGETGKINKRLPNESNQYRVA